MTTINVRVLGLIFCPGPHLRQQFLTKLVHNPSEAVLPNRIKVGIPIKVIACSISIITT